MLAKFKKNVEEDKDDIILQFVKFGLVGVSNTFVAWVCYYLILWIDEDFYIVGSFVGNIVGIANAFLWNDKYVFKSNNNDWRSQLKRLGRTYVSYGFTALLGILLLWIEVRYWGISKVIAPPVNILITLPLNFLINKFWAFGERQ